MGDIEIVPLYSPTPQGWYDPATGFWQHPDHQEYFQYNIVDLPDPFLQEEGVIYWLEICPFIYDGFWGWKTADVDQYPDPYTGGHFMDDAVWRGDYWIDLWEPYIIPDLLIHDFYLIVDPWGELVDWWAYPDWYGDGFYYYPWYEWWNIWFYDHPFVEGYKEIEVYLWYWDFFDPYYEMYFDFALNWSTDYWFYEGIPGEPPLPGVDEDLYIGRELMFWAWEPGYEWGGYYMIPWYNPEWVSADFRGYNYYVEGTIVHQCYPDPQSLDLAFVITGEGVAVKRPNPEDCATIAPGTRCSALPTCTPGPEPDDCNDESHCVPPPTGEPYPAVCYAPKTRYISIARHPEQAPDTARRIMLDDGTVLGWVGPPSFETPAQEPGGLWVANVVGAAHYETVWPDVVHVYCCPIAHASLSDVTEQHCNPNPIAGENCVHHSYHIQATTDGVVYSEVLELKTNTTWGDTVATGPGGLCMPPDGVPGLADIMAAINTFQGTYVAPITWVDIGPSNSDDCPERYVGLTDIMACIAGFQGNAYPGLGPKNCP